MAFQRVGSPGSSMSYSMRSMPGAPKTVDREDVRDFLSFFGSSVPVLEKANWKTWHAEVKNSLGLLNIDDFHELEQYDWRVQRAVLASIRSKIPLEQRVLVEECRTTSEVMDGLARHLGPKEDDEAYECATQLFSVRWQKDDTLEDAVARVDNMLAQVAKYFDCKDARLQTACLIHLTKRRYPDLLPELMTKWRSEWSAAPASSATLYQDARAYVMDRLADPVVRDALDSFSTGKQAREAKAKKEKEAAGLARGKDARKTHASKKAARLCSHCGKRSHNDEDCWIIHPALRPPYQAVERPPANRMTGNAPLKAQVKYSASDSKTKKNMPIESVPDARVNPDVEESASPREGQAAGDETAVFVHEVLKTPSDVVSEGTGADRSHAAREDENAGDRAKRETSKMRKMRTLSDPAWDKWLFVTGIDSHITNDLKWFEKGSICDVDHWILTPDGPATARKSGTVRLPLCTDDGSVNAMALKDVLYVPGSKCNILSGVRFYAAGYHVAGRNLMNRDDELISHLDIQDTGFYLTIAGEKPV